VTGVSWLPTESAPDRRRAGLLAAVGVALLALPFVFGAILASQMLVFAVFALGYNLLLGYGGELSFGHAAYFGIGAYGAVMTAQVIPNLLVALLVGVVAATLAGVVFGAFSLRRRGIYFSMITLAFAQMLYYLFLQSTGITGGSNGLSFPAVDGVGPITPGNATFVFYLTMLALTGVVFFAVYRIVHSPYGRVLVAIRENERRARSLGYEVNRFLLLAFVMSSFFSGFAGALYALLFAFVTPDLLFWTTSGNVVMMTIIGGVGTLVGPVVGSGIFLVLQEYLTEFFNVWEMVFGLIIVAVVLLAPRGVYGLYRGENTEDVAFDVRAALRRLRRD
jgi:branched-chain amino acid transport system permease protein